MTALTITPFVVTGCARSGTTYMAVTLSRLGLRCGHEVVFGPRTRSFEGFGRQHGDSSWLAAPFLGQLPQDTVVMHRIRHPLKVVNSLLGIRFFVDRSRPFLAADDAYTRVKWRVREELMRRGEVEPSDKGPRPHTAYRAFVHAYAPEIWDEPTPEERALRYWFLWNRMVEDGARPERVRYRRHFVERFDDADLSGELNAIGLPLPPEVVALVTESVPRDTNSKRVARLRWDDLPAGPARAAAERLAGEYGYDPRHPGTVPSGTAGSR